MFTLRWSVSEHPERWAGAVFLLSLSSLAIPAYQWLHAERENVGAVPRAIDRQGAETREWLRANALPIIQGAVDKANERTKQGLEVVQGAAAQVVGPDGQVAALRGDVMDMATMLSGHVGELTTTAERLRGDVNAELASFNATVGETAAPVQSLVKDAQDSWDDLYPDIKATTESATVAVTSAAQASEAVRDAAPELSASAVSMGDSFKGIAADAKREADEFTKPKTFIQKFADWVKLGVRFLAAWF